MTDKCVCATTFTNEVGVKNVLTIDKSPYARNFSPRAFLFFATSEGLPALPPLLLPLTASFSILSHAPDSGKQ